MYEDLKQREIDILFLIKKQIKQNGYPPTAREIADGVNVKSTSTVHSALNSLEEKDYIRRNPTKSRVIELSDQEDDLLMSKKRTVDVPILGQVTAGAPILAVENIDDTIPLPIDYTQDRDLFVLKVRGESMINIGIMDGDYVIIERRNFAKNRDHVLALLDEEATIKTFYNEGDCIRLQPENDFMDPIYAQEVAILGAIVGLYRWM